MMLKQLLSLVMSCLRFVDFFFSLCCGVVTVRRL